MSEMARRREIQREWNVRHGVTPRSVVRAVRDTVAQVYAERDYVEVAAGRGEGRPPRRRPVAGRAPGDLERRMREAAKDLRFEEAARLRDEMRRVEALILRAGAARAPARARAPRGGLAPGGARAPEALSLRVPWPGPGPGSRPGRGGGVGEGGGGRKVVLDPGSGGPEDGTGPARPGGTDGRRDPRGRGGEVPIRFNKLQLVKRAGRSTSRPVSTGDRSSRRRRCPSAR